MKSQSLRTLTWAARILGIAVAVFVGIFALDAFAPDKPIGRALLDFGVHLVPALVVLVLVALSWRRAWLGGVGFVALAVAYAMWARSRPDWVLVISGPLVAAGLLFFLSWIEARPLGRAR